MIIHPPSIIQNKKGFTLIEIITAIVLSSILAVVFVQINSNNTTRSYAPLQTMERDLALTEVMEEITSDYRQLIKQDHPTPIIELGTRIYNGRYWSTKPFAASIQAVYGCVSFTESPAGNWVSTAPQICVDDDTLYMVTLSYDGQTLTALFSR